MIFSRCPSYSSLVLKLFLANLTKSGHLADTNLTHLTRNTQPRINLEPDPWPSDPGPRLPWDQGQQLSSQVPDQQSTTGISRENTRLDKTMDQVFGLSTLTSVQQSLTVRGRETTPWTKPFTRARAVLS